MPLREPWIDVDHQVDMFLAADRAQKAALLEVDHTAGVKMRAVLALRDAGLTFSEIGRRVGLTTQGVQRIAYKANRP